MQVKDIMTAEIISVKKKTKVLEAAEVITKYRVHGLPVVEKDKVVGIITETDFFIDELSGLYLPSYIDFLKKAKFAHKVSMGKKKTINKLLKAKAEDIMTADCFTVFETLEVRELLKILIAKKYFTIPVVNKDRKIVGIVTQSDILNHVTIK